MNDNMNSNMDEKKDKTIKKVEPIPTSNHDTGVEVAKLNGYTIYQFRVDKYNYFLAIPDEYTDTYQMFIGFPKKDFKDTPKDEIISEIDDIKKMIAGINKNGIYIIPDIPLDMLYEASLENDNKKFEQILNDVIKPIIQDAYTIMKDYGSKDRTINQVINWIKQTESDTKFIQWIEINMPNFAYGITIDDLKNYYYNNKDTSRSIHSDEVFDKPPISLYNGDSRQDNNENLNNSSPEKVNSEDGRPMIKVLRPERPEENRRIAGFSNVFKTLLILSIIVVASIMIGLFILK